MKLEKREVVENLKLRIKTYSKKPVLKSLIRGGSGSSAAQAVGGLKDNPSQIYDFIAEGGNYTKESPGAPIAYKLSYVKQGFPAAKVVLATEYQARSCDLTHPQFKITINNLKVILTPVICTISCEGHSLRNMGVCRRGA